MNETTTAEREVKKNIININLFTVGSRQVTSYHLSCRMYMGRRDLLAFVTEQMILILLKIYASSQAFVDLMNGC